MDSIEVEEAIGKDINPNWKNKFLSQREYIEDRIKKIEVAAIIGKYLLREFSCLNR